MAPTPSNDSDAVGAKRLRSFVERIERLEEEKSGLAADIRDIYAEAKGTGYDTKALRKLIALRKVELETRREQDELLQLYMHALGMLDDTPLGHAAKERAGLSPRSARQAAQTLVDSTKNGGPSLEISAGDLSVKIEDGKVSTPKKKRGEKDAPTLVVQRGALQRPGFKGDVARVLAEAVEAQGGTVTEAAEDDGIPAFLKLDSTSQPSPI